MNPTTQFHSVFLTNMMSSISQNIIEKRESTSESVFLRSEDIVVMKKMPRRFKRQWLEANDPSYKRRMENARRELSESLEETTLQKLRLSKGLSQTQLAKLVGTTQPHLAKIEARQVSIYGETLKRLADILDVTMETIYELTRKTEPISTKESENNTNYFSFQS